MIPIKIKVFAMPNDNPSWWLTPLAEPHAQEVTPASGLATAEARSRLSRLGPNQFHERHQVPLLWQFRTRGNPLKSRAHPLLVGAALIVLTLAIALPFTPVGTYFGFVPPPAKFYLILGGMVVIYLFIVEMVKQGFYRWAVKKR
jgi:hypothetical protein